MANKGTKKNENRKIKGKFSFLIFYWAKDRASKDMFRGCAVRKVWAQASKVAPVVTMSSTRSMCLSVQLWLGESENILWVLSHRS